MDLAQIFSEVDRTDHSNPQARCRRDDKMDAIKITADQDHRGSQADDGNGGDRRKVADLMALRADLIAGRSHCFAAAMKGDRRNRGRSHYFAATMKEIDAMSIRFAGDDENDADEEDEERYRRWILR